MGIHEVRIARNKPTGLATTMAAGQARAIADEGDTALVTRPGDPLSVYVWRKEDGTYAVDPTGLIEVEWATKLSEIITTATQE